LTDNIDRKLESLEFLCFPELFLGNIGMFFSWSK
jgi:hypothetical protein